MDTKSRLSLARLLNIPVSDHNAFFLWGPRKAGKSTFLEQRFPEAHMIDLLDTAQQQQLQLYPHQLREKVLANAYPLVIVDEVQKIPLLLDEIHWCLENTATKFILCGSSARKLKHGAANLLGGRAWRYQMFPLTTQELGEVDLLRALNHGLLPQHYQAARPEKFLEAYVMDYLSEEIQAEAQLRNIKSFAAFFHSVAANHGQLLNYANVGRDCGVSPKTVRAYYQILEDTLLGFALEPWIKSQKNRLIETAKFYLCDPGIVRALKAMNRVVPKTKEFGDAFEHFMINEIRAYLSYRERRLPLAFWRTSTQQEVDLIVGDMALAIEFKAFANVHVSDCQGLMALQRDQVVKRCLLVSLDTTRRQLDNGILVVPWRDFCSGLWEGEWV